MKRKKMYKNHKVRTTVEKLTVCSKCNGSKLEAIVDVEGVSIGSAKCCHCNGSGEEPEKVTTDIKLLWKAVSKEVVDDTAKMALVEALMEANDFDTASALDWCIKRKRWPKLRKHWQSDKQKSWMWAPSSVGDAPKSVGNGLQRPIHEFVEHRNSSLQQAIENLRDGLVTIREMLPQWKQ